MAEKSEVVVPQAALALPSKQQAAPNVVADEFIDLDESFDNEKRRREGRHR